MLFKKEWGNASEKSFWSLSHSADIKYLAFATLNKALCLPVKVGKWAGERLVHIYCTDLGLTEGTADALFEFCASLVIEKRHSYIIIPFSDKIEPAFKGNPIMRSGKGAVNCFSHAILDCPVGDKLCDFTLPTPSLVVKITIMVPRERNVTERAGDEESSQVDEIEFLARFVRREELVEIHCIDDKIITPEEKVPLVLPGESISFSFIVRAATKSLCRQLLLCHRPVGTKSSFDTFKLIVYSGRLPTCPA
jgi:hypothetical protein